MADPKDPSRPAAPPDPASTDPGDWPVGRLLSAAARRVEREWDAHLATWDLNHASLPALVHLVAGPSSQRDLARSCGVTEQTMSRVLDRLERTGYVTRSTHDDDRRRHVLTISAAGVRALAAASADSPADRIATRGLTPEESEQLHRLLVRVARPDVATDPAAG